MERETEAQISLTEREGKNGYNCSERKEWPPSPTWSLVPSCDGQNNEPRKMTVS